MDNYEKRDVIKSFPDLDKDVVKCSQHGKLHGFIHFSKKQLDEKRSVTISGVGGAINKAVSTAEVLKTMLTLHQTNTIHFVRITEIWTPKENKDLQNIEVERKIPAISIKLQMDEPEVKELGYQAPDQQEPQKPIHKKPKFKKFKPRPKEKEDYPFVKSQTELENKVRDRKKKKRKESSERQKDNNDCSETATAVADEQETSAVPDTSAEERVDT